MAERLEVCSHIYDRVRDRCLREEDVGVLLCVACNRQVTVGNDRTIPAKALLRLLWVDGAVTN